MDVERYQELHAIIMLRDIIRKWWRSELFFADRSGNVLDWQRRENAPPLNDFCRLSIFSKEGFLQCSRSVQALHEKFRNSRKLRHGVVQDCHLNFQMAGAPLYIHGEYEGFLFVEGFLRAAPGGGEVESLQGKLRELTGAAEELERAAERLPLVGATELEKLIDLLELGTNEIASYEADLLRQGEPHVQPSHELRDRYKFENIVGNSAAMMDIFRLLEKVANSDSTVLINGESGTGKELVARAIHYNGQRRDKPFVVQNCSAFNDNLLESALFGHTKGSFTGALRDKKGLFEVADGGTFFLDEVGDMSPALQVKLLRVLQEGTFLPVGGTSPRQVDVRVIAATHKDLAALVKRGEFREDVYYRINVIRVPVPPLRERKEDIPLLIEHFLRKHRRPAQRTRGLSPAAMAVLTSYPWPGNIRELENEIERLLVLGPEHEMLPLDLLSSRIREAVRPLPAVPSSEGAPMSNLNEAVEMLERQMIQQGLQRTGNNKSKLARELGISRSNLILKIARYRLNAGASHGQEEADA